jgi:translation initiation factor 2 alpha subunit (eIF-2alpha)
MIFYLRKQYRMGTKNSTVKNLSMKRLKYFKEGYSRTLLNALERYGTLYEAIERLVKEHYGTF